MRNAVASDETITCHAWWGVCSAVFLLLYPCADCLCVLVRGCRVSSQALSQRWAARFLSSTRWIRWMCRMASPTNLSWLRWSARCLHAEEAQPEAPGSPSPAPVSGDWVMDIMNRSAYCKQHHRRSLCSQSNLNNTLPHSLYHNNDNYMLYYMITGCNLTRKLIIAAAIMGYVSVKLHWAVL